MHGLMTRRVVVRIPYQDERAEEFLNREAAQLPRGGPGLVMVDMGEAGSGFTAWPPLIARRLQPNVHTRVGGVCLFASHVTLGERGVVLRSETKIMINAHAKAALPSWISETLALFGSKGVLTENDAT